MVTGKYRILAMVLAASLTLLGAGCVTGETNVTGVPAVPKVAGLEKTALNVAVSPVVDSAGFFIALRDGLFAQEGLTVNYSPALADTVIAGQVKGQYDITATNYVSYIEAQVTHRADLRIVAEGSLLQAGNRVIMTMPRSKIGTLDGLRGQLLGVNPDLSVGFLLTASLLAENGIPINKNSPDPVKFPDFSMPYPDAAPALVSGRVAAAVMTEPFATQLAENYGAVTIADLSVGATQQFPVLGYAVTKAWARAYPNTLKAFQVALTAGQEIADTNRSAIEAAFVSLKPGEGHIDKRTAALMSLPSFPLNIDAARLQRVPDVMREFGFLKHRFNIQELLS